MAWFGPEIVDGTLTVFTAHIHELDEQFFAVGILEVGQVFAVEGRFDGVHDHLWSHIVDPEIILFVVAHGADEIGGQAPAGVAGPAVCSISSTAWFISSNG